MKFKRCAAIAQITLLAGLSAAGWAYDSGSTEVDGSFTPVVDTELTMPADGVFNFTNVDIPTGVTVTFAKNAANTPVILLASGNVNIAGTISVAGGSAADVGSAGDGNSGDDGIPGIGGPGGFDGGQPGIPGDVLGSAGLGPGGGSPAAGVITSGNLAGQGCGGEGGSFFASGEDSLTWVSSNFCDDNDKASGSIPYGNPSLLPLIGGSGGGGASAGGAFSGSGGGGGGGALLVAASGTVTVTGSINANGGESGASDGGQGGGSGGGGAGGAIRIIATTIEGDGPVTAAGGISGLAFGSRCISCSGSSAGGSGSVGRIRFEAETFTRTAATTPAFTFSQPDEIFLAGMPTLSITAVAGVTAPAVPTGNSDIVLPESTPNPITVDFATSGVPLGNTVTLRVIPARGETITAISSAIAGTEASATASASVNLPDGPSTFAAEVSYTVTVAMGESLSRYTDGVMVASVRLSHDAINGALTTLVTVEGKEVTLPSNMPMLSNAS